MEAITCRHPRKVILRPRVSSPVGWWSAGQSIASAILRRAIEATGMVVEHRSPRMPALSKGTHGPHAAASNIEIEAWDSSPVIRRVNDGYERWAAVRYNDASAQLKPRQAVFYRNLIAMALASGSDRLPVDFICNPYARWVGEEFLSYPWRSACTPPDLSAAQI